MTKQQQIFSAQAKMHDCMNFLLFLHWIFVLFFCRRLSSVSSTDPLSPYDPCEPFSPPTTPRLALPPTDMRSPLLSPTSPTPHFQAAPQLHPKYLFADYALPWKKVSSIFFPPVVKRITVVRQMRL